MCAARIRRGLANYLGQIAGFGNRLCTQLVNMCNIHIWHTLQIRLIDVDGKIVTFAIPIVLISEVPNGAA